MHIPDGFIDGKTAATTAALSAAAVGLALRRVKQNLSPRRVPLLGLAAAFLFAAQMINFPVAGGTSGHLVGGVLVGVLLGPSAAVVVLTTVLIVQSFLFADGGVLALGANIFNMALVGAVGGCAIFRLVSAVLPGIRGRVAAIAFAGWCSIVLGSISCAGQLAWSGTVAWSAVFPPMTSIHMLIGIGEGTISAIALLAVQRVRPDLVVESTGATQVWSWREAIPYGLLMAVGLALFVAPVASSLPDGLESVIGKLGITPKPQTQLMPALAPEYQLPGIGWASGATALAGVLGVFIVFGLALLLARSLVQKPQGKPVSPSHD
jgi:cobalt/nickel transport system permease protein